MCKLEKPVEAFYRCKQNSSGYSPHCKECHNKKGFVRYYENNYKITKEDFELMAANQSYLCLICQKKPEKLCVDHCHSSGKVRGLLCRKCNAALGLLQENPENLQRAISYLAQNSQAEAAA